LQRVQLVVDFTVVVNTSSITTSSIAMLVPQSTEIGTTIRSGGEVTWQRPCRSFRPASAGPAGPAGPATASTDAVEWRVLFSASVPDGGEVERPVESHLHHTLAAAAIALAVVVVVDSVANVIIKSIIIIIIIIIIIAVLTTSGTTTTNCLAVAVAVGMAM
jgi:hypothetical protein